MVFIRGKDIATVRFIGLNAINLIYFRLAEGGQNELPDHAKAHLSFNRFDFATALKNS